MNIFYLDADPEACAKLHNDKHVVKMIVESAQLLSTAHRVLDGQLYIDDSSGRKIKRFAIKYDPRLDKVLYKATHMNHPSAIWARTSIENYRWLARLNLELCKEYTYRYDKVHASEQLVKVLNKYEPHNISVASFTQPTPTMPTRYIAKDSISSYRAYYNGEKAHIAKWSKRDTPNWFGDKNV